MISYELRYHRRAIELQNNAAASQAIRKLFRVEYEYSKQQRAIVKKFKIEDKTRNCF